jgi:hypothetical protein
MSRLNKMSRLLGRKAAGAFILAAVALGSVSSPARAQDTTTTSVRHGESSFETQVRNARVVYVEGNDLVLKLENGKVEHFVVPESDRFTIDGSDVTVHELTLGTTLTQTITTTTAPHYVTTVRTLKGRIWHVNAHRSTVILTLPDGTNQAYTIPSHAKLTIGGESKTVYDLKKGMNLEATIVTDDTQTVMQRSKSITGEALVPPAMPQELGVLLILRPMPMSRLTPAPALVASTEQPASTLPKTGTLLPLAGLLGTLALATSLGMGAIRKAVRA